MPPFTVKPQFSYAGFSAERLSRWRGPLIFWGVGAGVAVSLFMSDVPLFQKDVLKKIPGVASYFEGEPLAPPRFKLTSAFSLIPIASAVGTCMYTDKTPASDKPF